jgi:hypothetical protein
MKINWGWRIVILYTGFVAGMSYLVYRCTAENIDLVTTDYYEKELQYDAHFEKVRNADALPTPVSVRQSDGILEITFPEDLAGDLHGTLHFYKPDDATLDFTLPLEKNQPTRVVPTGKMARGWWTLKADWSAHGRGYYHEYPFQLP